MVSVSNDHRHAPTASAIGAQDASDQNAETLTTMTAIKFVHEYEVRPRKDHRGVDLLSLCCRSVGCGTTRQMML